MGVRVGKWSFAAFRSLSPGGCRRTRAGLDRPGAGRMAGPPVAACRAGSPGRRWRCRWGRAVRGSLGVSAAMPGPGGLGQEESELERRSRCGRSKRPAGSWSRMVVRQGRHSRRGYVGVAAAVQAGGSLLGKAWCHSGAGGAAGVLGQRTPAEADRALPGRPFPVVFRHDQFGGSDRREPPGRGDGADGIAGLAACLGRPLLLLAAAGAGEGPRPRADRRRCSSARRAPLSRSSSRTEIGLPLQRAATLLSEGVNPASSKAFSRSAGRQMSRLAAAQRRFHFIAGSPCRSRLLHCPAARGQACRFRVGMGGCQVGNRGGRPVVAEQLLHLPQRHAAL